jgi:thiosulfate reductase cytochrome b subunit
MKVHVAPGQRPVQESEEAHIHQTALRSSRTVPVGGHVRRGLPRTVGGDRWPASSSAGTVTDPDGKRLQEPSPQRKVTAPQPAFVPPQEHAVGSMSDEPLRRGLPRSTQGDPWPSEGFAPADVKTRMAALDKPDNPRSATAVASSTKPQTHSDASAAEVRPEPVPSALAPQPAPLTAAETHRKAKEVSPAPEPRSFGPYSSLQMAGLVLGGGALLLGVGGILILALRSFLSLDFMKDFLGTYPGEYHLPAAAPVGLPAWLAWQHFFNVFLMVMIIRSGLTVRYQKRPPAMWTPRNGRGPKISIALWFHQSLDVLWLVNGAVFVALLFATGQWMRIVPTSWEVFPNALSAALQYASLDWPTENGWVNYNSLQQMAYFLTVFIAAPLAALSGFRMSGVWPKNAKKLSQAYPLEWARAVHFPVMVYFVIFIVVHVVLVLATGVLRNLNHMYGASDDVHWLGFWIFVASLAVITAGWFAARPLVLTSIARLFGKVSRN